MHSIPTIIDVQNTAEHPARLLELLLLRLFRFLGAAFFCWGNLQYLRNLKYLQNLQILVLRILLNLTKFFMRDYMRRR